MQPIGVFFAMGKPEWKTKHKSSREMEEKLERTENKQILRNLLWKPRRDVPRLSNH